MTPRLAARTICYLRSAICYSERAESEAPPRSTNNFGRMDRMARKVHRDRKPSGPDHKVRRAQRVRKVRIDRLCGSSVHILDQEGLAKPLRFVYPAVRLEVT